MKQEYSPELKEKFTATTYIDLTRHGNRFAGPVKIKLENGEVVEFEDTQELTPEGIETSRRFGATYSDEVSLVHPRGGDEKRHGQTGEHIMEGTDAKYGKEVVAGEGGERVVEDKTEPAPILTKEGKVKGARMGEGTDYKSSGMSMEILGDIKKLINTELSKMVNSLPGAAQNEILKPESRELRAKLREQAQVIGLKEAMKNDAMTKIAAENEAQELMHVVELSRRGVKAGETKAIPIVGSGMFAESLFKYALVMKDKDTGEKKIGFDDVDEIGGFTKQGTALRIKLERDSRIGDSQKIDDFEKDTLFTYEFTDPDRAKPFEKKDISLDWSKVKELAKAAEERLNRK